MMKHFKQVARGGLVDVAMMASLVACTFFCPPTVQEAFVGGAIASFFMVTYNATWRFGLVSRTS